MNAKHLTQPLHARIDAPENKIKEITKKNVYTRLTHARIDAPDKKKGIYMYVYINIRIHTHILQVKARTGLEFDTANRTNEKCTPPKKIEYKNISIIENMKIEYI
jgi:hypothetical protein